MHVPFPRSFILCFFQHLLFSDNTVKPVFNGTCIKRKLAHNGKYLWSRGIPLNTGFTVFHYNLWYINPCVCFLFYFIFKSRELCTNWYVCYKHASYTILSQGGDSDLVLEGIFLSSSRGSLKTSLSLGPECSLTVKFYIVFYWVETVQSCM
jgi:hypothetical protein